jgi:hypothetical protein
VRAGRFRCRWELRGRFLRPAGGFGKPTHLLEPAPETPDAGLVPSYLIRALLALTLALALSPATASAQFEASDDVAWEPDSETWNPGGEPWEESAEEEDGYGLPEPVEVPRVTTKTVAGRQAMLRTDGKAAVPRSAPARVRAIITAANRIVGKPYKWGGGHATLLDRGYDCSGTVSFPLITTGLLAGPMVSGSFARWGAGGAGRYVTIYANRGHVYMEVAGLRLDTSAAGDPEGRKGVRWRPLLGKRTGFRVRHPLGL